MGATPESPQAAAEPVLDADLLAAFEHLPDHISILAADGTVRWNSERGAAALGWTRDEMVGTNAYQHLHPDDVQMSQLGIMVGLLHPERLLPTALRYRHRDGESMLFETRGQITQLRDGDDVEPVIVVASRDLAMRSRFEDVMRSIAEGRPAADTFDAVLALASPPGQGWQASLVVAELERGRRDAPASEATLRVVAGTLPPELVDGDAYAGGESPWATAATTGEPLELTVLSTLPEPVREAAAAAGLQAVVAVPVPDPGSSHPAVIVVWADLSLSVPALSHWLRNQVAPLLRVALDQRWALAQLEWAASYDALTGLANRARLFEVLERCLGRCADDEHVGVLYLDLDGFKGVNDSLGHAAGDRVLAEAAARFSAAVRPTDVVGRLGGDELAIVIPACAGADAAEEVGRRLVAAMAEPVALAGGGEVRVGVSVGVALAGAGDSADGALHRADRALYAAKAGGRGIVVVADR